MQSCAAKRSLALALWLNALLRGRSPDILAWMLRPIAPVRHATWSRDEEASASAHPLTFDAIYGRWFHDVRRWARALGGASADCEDVAQDVFVIVRRKLPTFDGNNLPGWLYGITRRTVRDYRRTAWFRRVLGRTSEFDQDSPHFGGDGAIDDLRSQMDQREAWRELERIIGRMSEKHRAVFVLFEIEGYSGQEIAELEGAKLATIWSRLYQARTAFSAIVEELRCDGRES